MSSLPSIAGSQLIKTLRKLGFEVICSKGSHHFLRHSDGRSTVIPVHRGETIGRGLFAQVLQIARFPAMNSRKYFRRDRSLLSDIRKIQPTSARRSRRVRGRDLLSSVQDEIMDIVYPDKYICSFVPNFS